MHLLIGKCHINHVELVSLIVLLTSSIIQFRFVESLISKKTSFSAYFPVFLGSLRNSPLNPCGLDTLEINLDLIILCINAK